MNLIVFTGPTLTAAEGRELLDAEFLPPARQGDLYRAARRKPHAIGLIDGTFETTPAVWHKEILWALANGVHVFGSSSMGALRAAELSAYGMEGIGAVFEWFHTGAIEDDDEVAIAHADAEHDYRAASEAMVNVRATVQAALAAGIVAKGAADRILSAAKSLPFRERSFPAAIRIAREAGVSPAVLEAFSRFSRSGRVDQKREDAFALLREMKRRVPELARPKVVGWHFENTEFWALMKSQIDEEPAAGARGDGATVAAYLEELRLHGGRAAAVRRGMTLRALAERTAERRRMIVTSAMRDAVEEEYRRERALEDHSKLSQWLAHNEIAETAFEELLISEAQLRWFEALYTAADARHLVAELAASGELAAVRERARRKETVLREHGVEEPGPAEVGLEQERLLEWYFRRIGRNVPTEFAAYLREVGLERPETLVREASREYLFSRIEGELRLARDERDV